MTVTQTQSSSSQPVSFKLIVQIFLTFFRIGPVTFGGGYAMIPLIEREVVTKRKWVETKDLADFFAVAESVPGSIAVNAATFIGYRLGGVRGALAAMFGVTLPTFLIVVALSIFFLQVKDHPQIQAAFEGIKAAIVALIMYAAVKIGKTAVVDKMTLFLIVPVVFLLLLTSIHPVFVILIGGMLGIVLVSIRNKLGMVTQLSVEEKEEAKRNEEKQVRKYHTGDGT